MAFEELYAGLDTSPLPQLAQRYSAAVEGSTRFLAGGTDPSEPDELRRAVICDRFVFSDTVILVSIDDAEDAAEDVLCCAWRTAQCFFRGRSSASRCYRFRRDVTLYDLRSFTAWHLLLSPGIRGQKR